MPLPRELAELMLDSITVEPQVGIDRFNNFSYGPAVAAKCKIIRYNKRVLDIKGREVTSTVQVILADPTLVVDTNARMTLPDGSQPALIDVLSSDDDKGPFYLELRA